MMMMMKQQNENQNQIHQNPNRNQNQNPNLNQNQNQQQVCARGHWRPAEDEKLKELVALYGPQNWNLIAERLEGRSGKN
jgi:myb proto-oncogene protein